MGPGEEHRSLSAGLKCDLEVGDRRGAAEGSLEHGVTGEQPH
jgi:hypothetical protein